MHDFSGCHATVPGGGGGGYSHFSLYVGSSPAYTIHHPPPQKKNIYIYQEFQATQKIFEILATTEDDDRMEVDHYSPARRCYKCNKTGHLAKDCRSKPCINAVDNTKEHNAKHYKKEMTCWYCAKKGHFKHECRKRLADLNRGQGAPRVQPARYNQEN